MIHRRQSIYTKIVEVESTVMTDPLATLEISTYIDNTINTPLSFRFYFCNKIDWNEQFNVVPRFAKRSIQQYITEPVKRYWISQGGQITDEQCDFLRVYWFWSTSQ